MTSLSLLLALPYFIVLATFCTKLALVPSRCA